MAQEKKNIKAVVEREKQKSQERSLMMLNIQS